VRLNHLGPFPEGISTHSIYLTYEGMFHSIKCNLFFFVLKGFSQKKTPEKHPAGGYSCSRGFTPFGKSVKMPDNKGFSVIFIDLQILTFLPVNPHFPSRKSSLSFLTNPHFPS